MHTYKTEDGFIFHYNSDFSGDVKITRVFGGIVQHVSKLPGKSLVQFIVGAYIIPRLKKENHDNLGQN